jgi:hypothetical protein
MGTFLHTKFRHPQGTIKTNAGHTVLLLGFIFDSSLLRANARQDKQENNKNKYHSHGIYY